jgi:hypothetical protein
LRDFLLEYAEAAEDMKLENKRLEEKMKARRRR